MSKVRFYYRYCGSCKQVCHQVIGSSWELIDCPFCETKRTVWFPITNKKAYEMMKRKGGW